MQEVGKEKRKESEGCKEGRYDEGANLSQRQTRNAIVHTLPRSGVFRYQQGGGSIIRVLGQGVHMLGAYLDIQERD